MAKFIIGLFIILHGLVHLWYVVLSQQLVEYRPEMGWTGKSWILTHLTSQPTTRFLAGALYGLAAVTLVAGGVGVMARSSWWPPVLLGSAALSAVTIFLFWDGSPGRVVEKGLIGLMISLAIGGAAAISVPYRSEIRARQARLESLGSRVAETDCGPIEYARLGEGYPVLVVHGNAGGFDQGLGLAQGYLGPGFQVIAPSRFGYLRSPLPAEATPALQAEAYACLLDSLGIRQVAVFALSAGVTSSVQFARLYPERVSALVLQSPNAPGTVGLAPPPEPVFNALMHSDFTYWALTTYFGSSMQSLAGVPKDFSLTPQYLAEARATLSNVSPVSQRADGILFDTYVSNPEINAYPLGEVVAPTLVISAVDDPMALHAGARILADGIPHARLLPVRDGGHLLLGHTAEMKAEITQFLLDQTAETADSQ